MRDKQLTIMTKIQWTDETWNPIVGCSRISEGCKNCYAASTAKSPRLQQFSQYQKVSNWDGTVEWVESQIYKPIGWKKPKRIFVCSMGDLFHENVPFEWIDRVMAVMCYCKHHIFQVLTKRPDIAHLYFNDYLPDVGPSWKVVGKNIAVNFKRQIPLRNVWLGTSVENQKVAGDRILPLMETSAAIRFLSCEPLLENLDLSQWLPEALGKGICDACGETGQLYAVDKSPVAGLAICTQCCPRPDWILVGGESGTKARPCHQDWIRSIIQQCQIAKVSVFVKQLGSHSLVSQPYIQGVAQSHYRISLKNRKGGDFDEFPDDLKVRQFPQI